jgi:hypothetical protein
MLQGESDYRDLPHGLPAVKAIIDSGHMGTYTQRNGGKYAKAAVEYFKLVLKNDQRAKSMLVGEKKNSVLIKDGWEITAKNW